MEAQDVDIEVIMPPFVKYHGYVNARGSTRYRAAFYPKIAGRQFETHQQAVECIIAQNALENNRRVKNIVYRQGNEYKCKLPKGMFFLFDAETLPLVHTYFWSCTSQPYVRTTIAGETGHRVEFLFTTLLMGSPPPGYVIDHINRNHLDNRKSNLRLVTVRINRLNVSTRVDSASGVTGVRRCRGRDWIASWRDETGKPRSRGFAIAKYGEEEAKQKACEYRKKMESELPHYREALCLS